LCWRLRGFGGNFLSLMVNKLAWIGKKYKRFFFTPCPPCNSEFPSVVNILLPFFFLPLRLCVLCVRNSSIRPPLRLKPSRLIGILGPFQGLPHCRIYRLTPLNAVPLPRPLRALRSLRLCERNYKQPAPQAPTKFSSSFFPSSLLFLLSFFPLLLCTLFMV